MVGAKGVRGGGKLGPRWVRVGWEGGTKGGREWLKGMYERVTGGVREGNEESTWEGGREGVGDAKGVRGGYECGTTE